MKKGKYLQKLFIHHFFSLRSILNVFLEKILVKDKLSSSTLESRVKFTCWCHMEG